MVVRLVVAGDWCSQFSFSYHSSLSEGGPTCTASLTFPVFNYNLKIFTMNDKQCAFYAKLAEAKHNKTGDSSSLLPGEEYEQILHHLTELTQSNSYEEDSEGLLSVADV